MCKKRSGGSLPGKSLDLRSVDVLRSVTNLSHQLQGVQSPEPLLGNNQDLPDQHRGVFHCLETLGGGCPQPQSGEESLSSGLVVSRRDQCAFGNCRQPPLCPRRDLHDLEPGLGLELVGHAVERVDDPMVPAR